jgi:RNA polymerase sigma-70 factor (ECF subfamily)
MTQTPILYIEDEEDYQLLVKKILGRAGLEVVTADSGREGLEKLAQVRPSLLILDINLPDTDGYKICAQLRQDPAWVDLPILMLTVRRRPEEWLNGFASGANDYISKPLNPPELIERVVTCLEGRAHQPSRDGSPEYHLVQAAVTGNRAAFEVLIQQYKSRLVDNLMANGYSHSVSDDIVATAFLKAYENMAQFRGEASFYTWLYRIAMNKAKDFHERSAHTSFEGLCENEEGLPASLGVHEHLDERVNQKEVGARAMNALRLVPEPYREMLDLFFIQEMSYDAIAAKLDIPMGTVMSRLHKARGLLQEAWNKKEQLHFSQNT